ncbi:MAG: hypothetical protein R3B09_03255 [Nannocystaceae bacterium]
MHHRIHTLLVAALAVGASACTGYTGVKGSKKLSELDADERKEVCENSAAHTKEEIGEETIKRYGCVLASVLASGGGVPECEAAVDICVMDATIESNDTCDVDGDVDCDATIEEYEACGDENIAGLKVFYQTFTCEAAINGSVMAPEAGPECQALAKKCPGLFSTMGE